MPATIEALVIIVLLVVPGFVCWQQIASHVPSTFVSDAHWVTIALIFSIVVHVVALPATVYLADRILAFTVALKHLDIGRPITMDWLVFGWLVLVLFFIPAVIALMASGLLRANWSQPILHRFGLSAVKLTPKAWDWFFLTQTQGCWVVAEMDDGSLVGGVYDVESFVSLSPHAEDLYLEKCYYVDSEHNFGEPVPDNAGVWISGSRVLRLFFYRTAEE